MHVRAKTEDASVRVGVLTEITGLLRSFGVDHVKVLAQAGLPTTILDDPDGSIAYGARGRLLNLCAARTRCEHFGLLLGQRGRFSHFGLVGFLVQHSPDVGTALRNFERYFHLHVRRGAPSLSVRGDVAFLGYDVDARGGEGRDLIEDAAMAIACNIMRSLCGADWAPAEVRLAHRKPRDARPFSRFFRCPLRFDAIETGFAFPSDVLNRPLPEADADLRRLLQRQVDALDRGGDASFPDRVRGVLRTAILTGHGTVEDLATMFSLHSRTMHRRLAEFGVTFKALADETRFEIARRMLEDSAMTIRQIAEALDYADASAFTRAFRRWTKSTPAVWRAGLASGRARRRLRRSTCAAGFRRLAA